MVRIESECYANDEKVYCLEFDFGYLEIPNVELDDKDENEQVFIVGKDGFSKLFDFIKPYLTEKNLVTIECNDSELVHYFDFENFTLSVWYDTFSLRPDRIGFSFKDVDFSVWFFVV